MISNYWTTMPNWNKFKGHFLELDKKFPSEFEITKIEGSKYWGQGQDQAGKFTVEFELKNGSKLEGSKKYPLYLIKWNGTYSLKEKNLLTVEGTWSFNTSKGSFYYTVEQ